MLDKQQGFRSTDLELGQCHVRLGVAVPFLLLWFAIWYAQTSDPAARIGLAIMVVFCVYAVTLWLHVRRFPGENTKRRVVAITVDQSATFSALLLPEAMGGVVLFLPLWITLGNGIRFGVKWMAFSASLALAGVIGLGLMSAYWAEHLPWLIGLALLNVAVPLYMASLIAGVHENRSRLASYADAMKSLALKDSLTGLPNRTAFFEALERASAHAGRNSTALAILYFDLNGFKQVNDAYGHATGDKLLREVARQVQEELRAEDVLARLGGDEFVALLQLGASARQPEQVAYRVLQVLAEIRSIEDHALEVAASIGIVVIEGQDAAALGAEHLVELADLNMYAAKRAGRSQIVMTYHVPEARMLARA